MTAFDTTNIDEYDRRRDRVVAAFSPAAPITSHTLFAGRSMEITKVMDVVAQRGRHAMIYGERGVGKTSLARVTSQMLGGRYLALYYTCSTVDTYASIWTGILEEAEVVSLRYRAGFRSGYESVLQSAAKLFRGEDPTPNSVRQVLQTLASSSQLPVVVVVDEFDRIETSGTRRLFADTIKILSDQAIPATLGHAAR